MHKTISVQGRVDITSLATLARAYLHEGHNIKSKSDILWRAVEQLSIMYCRKHGTEAFATIPDALEYMESIGLSLGTNSRAQKAILQAQSDESYFMEFGEDVPAVTTKKSLSQMTPEEMQTAAERIARSLLNGGASKDEG